MNDDTTKDSTTTTSASSADAAAPGTSHVDEAAVKKAPATKTASKHPAAKKSATKKAPAKKTAAKAAVHEADVPAETPKVLEAPVGGDRLSALAAAAAPVVSTARARVQDAYAQVAHVVGPYLEQVEQTVKPYVVQAERTVKPYVEQAEQTVKPYVEQAEQTVKPYATALRERADEARKTLGAGVVELRTVANKRTDAARERVEAISGDVRRGAGDAVTQLRNVVGL